jgi:Stress responsive A/B Barrel Domain
MLRHVVIWSMAEGHERELDDLLRELRELPGKIDEIAGLSAGRLLNESGLEGVLCVDVADADALERYRSHPAHQPVLTRIGGTAAELVVADYEY